MKNIKQFGVIALVLIMMIGVVGVSGCIGQNGSLPQASLLGQNADGSLSNVVDNGATLTMRLDCNSVSACNTLISNEAPADFKTYYSSHPNALVCGITGCTFTIIKADVP